VNHTEGEGAPERLKLTALRLAEGMELRPAALDRAWMETPGGRFAKRCLPLVIANQAGWELLNPAGFTAIWEGRDDLEAVKIWPDGAAYPFWVTSHFGLGIVTWHIPYLFRTPRGYNLLVRGPANQPKDGIAALEGLVETDWAIATFTMNWKFTRAGHAVRFEAGEPFAMLVPTRRGELEAFTPEVRDIVSEPETFDAFQRFSKSRQDFLAMLKSSGAMASPGWQRDYMLGRDINGAPAPAHQTRLHLSPFTRR